VLLLLLFPVMWLFVFPFVYLIVNVAFWASPIWWMVRWHQGQIAYFWGLVLGACTVLAWLSPFLVTTVGPGCIVWACSITLAAAAFVVPMPREAFVRPSAERESPERMRAGPPKVVVREPLPEALPAIETTPDVVLPVEGSQPGPRESDA
jgi:hypothetical protein